MRRRSVSSLALLSLGILAIACGEGLVDNSKKAGSAWDNPGMTSRSPAAGSNVGAPPADPCKPQDAPSIFKNALCLCGDLRDAGALLVKNGVTTDPASLGINGFFRAASHTAVDGSMAAYSGLEAIANIEVAQSLWSSGNVNFTGRIDVGQDLMVGGALFGIGVLDVDGTLGVLGAQTILGGKDVAQNGAYQPLSGPPCACGANAVLDVKAKVAEARTQNDNGAVGLPQNPVTTIGVAKLVLNSGRYYFATKAGLGYTKVVANGAVQIFIDGDYDAIGYDRFEVTEGSSLDVYVAGNIHTVGNMVLGDKHHPSAFRIYIGGSEKVGIQVGNNIFRGSIYAPNASLVWVGNTKVEGSLFAKTIESVGLLTLEFARPSTGEDGKKCTPPGGSSPPSSPSDPPDPKDLPKIL